MTMRGPRALTRGRRLWRDRDGNLTVEMAFFVPIMVAVTIGMMDVGRAIWTISALDNAAREGARYAAIHGPNADRLGWTATQPEIKGVIRDAYIGIGKDGLTDDDISILYQDGFGAAGQWVKVRIEVDFFFWTYGKLTGKATTLSGYSEMTMM